MDTFVIFAVSIAFCAVYFMPTIIAAWRGHRRWAVIALVDLLLGWTFVGWIIAAGMALSNDLEPAMDDLRKAPSRKVRRTLHA